MSHLFQRIEQAMAMGSHVIVQMPVEDRIYLPEHDIGPSNLEFSSAQYFDGQDFRTVFYTPTGGFQELIASDGAVRPLENGNIAGSGGGNPSNPVAAMNQARRLLTDARQKWLVIIDYQELYIPQTQHNGASGDGAMIVEMLHRLSLDDGILAGDSRMMLITHGGELHDMIQNSRGFICIDLCLPDQQQRQAFIGFLQNLPQDQRPKMGQLNPGLDGAEAGRLLKGLYNIDIEKLFKLAGKDGLEVDRKLIREHKSRVLSRLGGDLIEVSEPVETLDELAGNPSLKDYLSGLVAGLRQGASDVAQAILLQGPPGTGKTHGARVLAGTLGWPLVIMRNVRGSYVGQSERNLERVLRLINELAPVIFFMDEVDQSVGPRNTGPSGDSGVQQRIVSRLLEALGSMVHRGKLLFVAATNMPQKLDFAFLDRFGGASIPMLRPGPRELIEMAPMVLNRAGHQLGKLEDSQLVGLLEPLGLTGREYQELMLNAARLANKGNSGPSRLVECEHIQRAVFDHIPRQNPLILQVTELYAVIKTSRHSLLPWNTDGGLIAEELIPSWMRENGSVNLDGRLNIQRIHQVIKELSQITGDA